MLNVLITRITIDKDSSYYTRTQSIFKLIIGLILRAFIFSFSLNFIHIFQYKYFFKLFSQHPIVANYLILLIFYNFINVSNFFQKRNEKFL